MIKNKKIAVINGASGNIGKEITEYLTDHGYFVYGTYFSKKIISTKYSSFLHCDVSNEDSIKEFIEALSDKQIDLLINMSAPSFKLSKFDKTPPLQFRKDMEIIFFGATQFCRLLLPRMNKGSLVINLLSEAVINTPQGMSSYICAKSALLGLTKSLSVEYANKDIRVNAISPGMCNTKFIKDFPTPLIELTINKTPLRRLCTAKDIIIAIEFLIESGFITGANIPLTGGNAY